MKLRGAGCPLMRQKTSHWKEEGGRPEMKGNDGTGNISSRDTEIKLNHISTFLSELSEDGLIGCLNKEEKKGRFYKITKKGLNVLDFILKNSGGNK